MSHVCVPCPHQDKYQQSLEYQGVVSMQTGTRSTKHVSINVTIESNFTILLETFFSLLSIVNNKSETQAPINTINKKTTPVGKIL
jgi:hypothetical protein